MFEYKFYTNNKGQKVVLCLTYYNGKAVKGKSTCALEDTYDEEYGKLIAMNRCLSNYLRKRIKDKYAFVKSKDIEWKQKLAEYDRADKALKELCQRYVEVQELLAKEINK